MTQPPANVVPVCYRHPDRETYVRCVRCDRPICPNCMNEASVGFQCPECVREGAKSQRSARTAFGGGQEGAAGTVTITLIVINVLFFLATVISSGSASSVAGGGMGGLFGSITPLHEWGALVTYRWQDTDGFARVVPGGMADGEYYRLLTSMFLHYGILHLLMNMWALWVLGRPIEAMLGRVRFLALYMIAGLGGGVVTFLFASPLSFTAGASGAVFGLFLTIIILLRKMRRSVAQIVPVLLINLVLTFTLPGLSVTGHVGGLLVGGLAAAGLAYAPRQQRNAIQAAALAVIVLALLVLTVVHAAGLTPGSQITIVS